MNHAENLRSWARSLGEWGYDNSELIAAAEYIERLTSEPTDMPVELAMPDRCER